MEYQAVGSDAKVSPPRREAQLTVHIHGDTKDRARQAAEAEHMTLSAFVEEAVGKLAEEVLSRRDKCHLTEDDILLLEEVMSRALFSQRIVCSEIFEYNNGGFDSDGRYF